MPTILSVDLRRRVVSAVAAGATCRQAAERYGVSRASVSRWSQQKQREGHVAPKPLGGDQRSTTLRLMPNASCRPPRPTRRSSCASYARRCRRAGLGSAPAASRASSRAIASAVKKGDARG